MNARVRSEERPPVKDLADALRAHRDEIVVRWTRLYGQSGSPRNLTHEQLVDHLPPLIDRLADALEGAGEGRAPPVPLEDSQAHTLNRLDCGFDLPQVAREYGLLRRVIFGLLAEKSPHLIAGGFNVVGAAIDEILADSVDCYANVRHRTLEALDQVTQVVAGPGDLDTILHDLLSVVMQTVPAADGVALLLKQGDVLTIKEALGITAEHPPSRSLRVGEGFAGRIAATKQSTFLASSDTDSFFSGDFLRDRNIKAIYGVPLLRGADVIGVAHMSSLTASQFAEEDKLLFRTVAERATGILVQANLLARERASRVFLETTIENIKEGVLVASGSGEILLASTGAADIFGVSREALRMPLEEFNQRFVPRTPEGQPVQPAVLQALKGEDVPAHERIVTDARGRDHRLMVSATAIRGEEASGAVVVFVDVTDDRKLRDELRRAVAFRERLMGIVSHDLRSPLAVIAMAAQSLLRMEAIQDGARSAASKIHRAAERMSRMVSDLLDFTRVAAGGGLPMLRRSSDLRALIREAVDELDVGHAGRIRLTVPDREIEGSWDADRLHQVVTNLVSNALQYGAKDAPIVVRLERGSQEVTLSVNNRGPVIPRHELATLFDPFQRGRTGAHGRGLGLGLHIVFEVVRAHQGTVDVTSDGENGTTFTVHFPLPSSNV